MKRKSTLAILSAVICLVMAVAMVLPMGVVAAEAETVTGFTFADQYYHSDWVGSEVATHASYARWVKTDGQYNGCIQWSSEYEKVTYDPEKGTLTFRETTKPAMKFFPGQIATNPLSGGACYLSFDIYYDSGTYKQGDTEVANFSGLEFIYTTNDKKESIFFSIGKDGKFYAGESVGYNKNAVPEDQLAEGWNTIEMIILPKDKDGNVVETSNGVFYYKDTNGDGKYDSNDGSTRNDQWPVKSTDLYLNVANASNSAETRAYTQAELDRGWYKVENFNLDLKFYGNEGGIKGAGESTNIKPIEAGKGEFTMANVRAIKLGVEQEIFQYTYEGYSDLTQSVPASSTNKVVTVPSALKEDGTAVKSWFNEALDKFLKPGDTVTIEANTTFGVATGADEARGELGSALDRVRDDLSTYTYHELQAEIDNIEAAALAAGLDEGNALMIRKDELIGAIEERMGVVEEACAMVIEYADIFSDNSLDLPTRAEAYDAVKEYLVDFDATYDDDSAAAQLKLDGFQAYWNMVEGNYLAYQEYLLQIDDYDNGPEKNEIFALIISNYTAVATAFSSFELDPAVIDGYLENMTSMKELFDKQENIVAMFEFLYDWVEDWANFNDAVYYGNAEELPTPLADAVKKYNDTVKELNEELAAAATLAVTLEQNIVDTEVGNALISDIKSRLKKLYDAAQEPVEE